jgi:hypothetical protein
VIKLVRDGSQLGKHECPRRTVKTRRALS